MLFSPFFLACLITGRRFKSRFFSLLIVERDLNETCGNGAVLKCITGDARQTLSNYFCSGPGRGEITKHCSKSFSPEQVVARDESSFCL